jgi:hypothetical protein
MASIRQAAQNVLGEARDGIAWIAFWKDGRGWKSETFYPDYDENTQRFKFTDDELDALNDIVHTDRTACFVNSWYHNLGDTETMTRDSLASTLRWQYDLGHAMLWSTLQNCA